MKQALKSGASLTNMSCQLPWPVAFVQGKGSELTTECQDLLHSFANKSQPFMVENSSPNLVEQMHRTLVDMIRSKDFT